MKLFLFSRKRWELLVLLSLLERGYQWLDVAFCVFFFKLLHVFQQELSRRDITGRYVVKIIL